MSNLQHRQQKIQAKRKQTPRREFVMEICSWKPIMFYKNQGILSIYPDIRTKKITTIKQYQDFISGKYLDVNGNIFELFVELINLVGFSNVSQMGGENCDFSDTVVNSKSIYLSNVIINNCENILYSLSIKDNSSNILNSIMCRNNCQNIYNSSCIISSYNIFYTNSVLDSNNIWFSSNLIGCNNCIRCDNLINQSFCIENKQYTKDEYDVLKVKYLYNKRIFCEYKNISNNNIACANTDGKSNIGCTDCNSIFLSYNTNTAHNAILHGSAKGCERSYDCLTGGSPYSSDLYAVMGAGASENIYCSIFVNGGSSNIFYSIDIESCSFCLGCIGLKNKSYCILNKQYTKEERYDKVDEVFGQMEKDGTLGDFFPATMNPFYFNDTAAYLIDPSFTKEEVTAKGYLWRDEVIKVDIPADAQIVSTSELDQYEGYDADGKRTINPSILDKVIQDPQGNVYKIVKMELAFLIKHGLPLPRKHWLDRMKENFRIG